MACRALATFPLLLSYARSQFTIDDQEYSHQWISQSAMPSSRSDLTATTVGDGIYLIGGCANDQEWSVGADMYLCSGLTKKVEKYLPASDSFEALTDAPRTRYRHTAAAVGSQIFVFGGCDISDAIVTEVDVLDTQTGQWSTLSTSMPNATSDLSSFVSGGKVYLLGGYNRPNYDAQDKVLVFDPAQSGASAWSDGQALTQGRGDAASAVAGDVAFALGGFHHSNWSYPMDHLEVMFLSSPSGGWKARAAMSVARGDKAVAVLNGKLHVVGGESKNQDGHSTPLMDVEVYDVETDTWFPGGSIPSHRFRFTAAAHGDSIYLFGGQGALIGSHNAAGSKYPVLNTVEQYKETITTLVSSCMHAGLTIVLPLMLSQLTI
ncbi:unnamed protein product [Effrenium voratum]|nr:unnamed protein product [Effrenium voratum]